MISLSMLMHNVAPCRVCQQKGISHPSAGYFQHFLAVMQFAYTFMNSTYFHVHYYHMSTSSIRFSTASLWWPMLATTSYASRFVLKRLGSCCSWRCFAMPSARQTIANGEIGLSTRLSTSWIYPAGQWQTLPGKFPRTKFKWQSTSMATPRFFYPPPPPPFSNQQFSFPFQIIPHQTALIL